MAEWLGGGLQNRSPRFNSGSRLQRNSMSPITISQVIVALLLSTCILMQQQGVGLGGGFGGEGNIYRSKRGVEKFLFYGTIVLAIAFFVLVLVAVITQ